MKLDKKLTVISCLVAVIIVALSVLVVRLYQLPKIFRTGPGYVYSVTPVNFSFHSGEEVKDLQIRFVKYKGGSILFTVHENLIYGTKNPSVVWVGMHGEIFYELTRTPGCGATHRIVEVMEEVVVTPDAKFASNFIF